MRCRRWTIKNRPRYNRDKLRYPSDLTEAEWAHIKPLIPPAKRGGGKRRYVCSEYRMPVALHPEGPAAAQHGERLLLPVELQRHVGGHSPCTLRQMPRAG